MSFCALPDAADLGASNCHTSSYVSATQKCANALVGLAPKNLQSTHKVNVSFVAFPQKTVITSVDITDGLVS